MSDSQQSGQAWSLHAILPVSVANGPGKRFVVWTQGCDLGCAGCFNPETHEFLTTNTNVDAVAQQVSLQEETAGVTVTGGEPLRQPKALARFLYLVSEMNLSSIVLTGFSRPEIKASGELSRAIQHADVVIHGRYNELRHLGIGLRGSANKELWFRTDRLTPPDFANLPQSEILIDEAGGVVVSGMHGGILNKKR